MFHRRWTGKLYQYQNTRQYLRLPASWPIKLEPKTAANGRLVRVTKDVSAGGVAVIVREMIPVGSRIHLEIHVPHLDRTIPAQGQVVRCLPFRREGFELGIRFDEIKPQDRADLSKAVENFISPRQQRRHKGGWWRRVS